MVNSGESKGDITREQHIGAFKILFIKLTSMYMDICLCIFLKLLFLKVQC